MLLMHYIYGHAIMYIVQAGVLVEGLKWLHRNWTSTYLKRERRTVRSRIFLAGGVPGRGRSQGKTPDKFSHLSCASVLTLNIAQPTIAL